MHLLDFMQLLAADPSAALYDVLLLPLAEEPRTQRSPPSGQGSRQLSENAAILLGAGEKRLEDVS